MKKENIYNALFSLISLGLVFFMVRADKLMNKCWSEVLNEQPLPAVTEKILQVSPYWPFIFCLIFILNIFITWKNEKVGFHVLMLSVVCELSVILIIFISYLLPFITISNEGN